MEPESEVAEDGIYKLFGFTLGAALFARVSTAEAQQPKKVIRIGYLSYSDPPLEFARVNPFGLDLCELGYIEGHEAAALLSILVYFLARERFNL